MISIFTRQVTFLRRGDHGQAAVLLLTCITAVLSLVFAAVYVSYLGAEKVATANAVDAIALSAATWEARGLNMIAALNDGILQCFRLIRWTCVVWGAMAVAACTGLGLPTFLEYSRRAAQIIRSSWRTARQFAQWSEKIKDAVPFLVLAETADLSRKLNVTGVLYPFDPRGPRDHERTLELHLVRSAPISLIDALSPIHDAKRKIGKWKWARKIVKRIVGIIDQSLRTAIGTDPVSLTMLLPEDHLPERQKIRFAGYREISSIPVPFHPPSSRNRFPIEASAEPYGGGVADMSWKSRFTEWKRER